VHLLVPTGHPVEKLVPLATRHALPSDMLDGVAGGPVEANGLAPWSFGQSLGVLRHRRRLLGDWRGLFILSRERGRGEHALI